MTGIFRVLAAALLVCATASAAFGDTIFFDRAAFLASAERRVVVVEGFESFPTCPNCESGGPAPLTALATAAFTVSTSPTAGGTSFLCLGTTNPSDPHPTEGRNALVIGSTSFDPFVLTFDLERPTWAVGFDLTDAAETGSAVFSTERVGSVVVAQASRPSGSELFFGYFADQPFMRFQLTNTGFGDGWGIDQVTLVSHPVPEPASLLLLGAGLTVAGLMRRRHR